MLVLLKLRNSFQTLNKFLFDRFIFWTNIGISVSLSALGDAAVQYKDDKPTWNYQRSVNMALSGVTVGIPSHFWYVWLDDTWPGKSAKTIVKKVIADQLFSPVLILIFFFTVGVLEQTPSRIMRAEFHEKAPKLFLAECCFWPLAQTINFTVLPTHFRILYINTAALVMDMYSSYLKYDTD